MNERRYTNIPEKNNYENYREQKHHGDPVFPFGFYPCAIPELFPEVLTHWHDEMEIIRIRRGTALITVNQESRRLTAPAMALVLPGQLHAIAQVGTEQVEYENIIFHPRLLKSGDSTLFDREYLEPLLRGEWQIPVFLMGEDENFRELAEPLEWCVWDPENPGYPLQVKAGLFRFCGLLLQKYPRKRHLPDNSVNLERIKPILNYLMEHYNQDIRVADVADFAGFSEGHFMRFFKEIIGVSFVTYLRAYRLSRAEELLRTTDTSILEVSEETGFRNLSYFIRNFKERYGITPLKYREARAASPENSAVDERRPEYFPRKNEASISK